MFVTDSLREQVRIILLHMDERALFLSFLANEASPWEQARELRWSAERSLHVCIECVTDVANIVIDALVMRDPANYEDMLRVLEEEGVVTADWFNAFVPIFDIRASLVREYVQFSQNQIRDAVRTYTSLFPEYAHSVRNYLKIV